MYESRLLCAVHGERKFCHVKVFLYLCTTVWRTVAAKCSKMVVVAQLAESQIVVLVVVGSSPTGHPGELVVSEEEEMIMYSCHYLLFFAYVR